MSGDNWLRCGHCTQITPERLGLAKYSTLFGSSASEESHCGIGRGQDEAAAQRSADKVKVEKLVQTVSETVESNLERFNNSSMKIVLADTLVPRVSAMIEDFRVAIIERTRMEGEVGR